VLQIRSKTPCNFGSVRLKSLDHEKYAGSLNGSSSGLALHFSYTRAVSGPLCVPDTVLILRVAQHTAVGV
jgi:hypothetical protein